MARPLFVRIFTDELPLKILSLVLAVTLFVLVRNDKDATSGAYVKVIYTLPEDRVLVSDPVPEVKVSVRGPWTKLQHLDRSLEPLHIDLTRVHTPEVRIDEDMIKVPAGVRVSSIVPSEVHVEFEPVGAKRQAIVECLHRVLRRERAAAAMREHERTPVGGTPGKERLRHVSPRSV